METILDKLDSIKLQDEEWMFYFKIAILILFFILLVLATIITMNRISRSDYDIIRSDILHNYELLFTIEENQFYNISNPIMEVHIYSPTY